MRGNLSKISNTSSEIGGSRPRSGTEQERETGGGNQFAFAVKFLLIVGLVLLGFWLLDRAV
jgi:hypothetical protein